MSVFAIIPVKKLDAAKSRLSPLLSNNERRQLCLKMLEDVLTAIKATRRVHWVVVVSVDPVVLQAAKSFDVFSLMESQPGLNQAVSEAINWCVQNGAKSTLILPADIPSVTSADLNWILSLGRETTMIISPSRSGDGTNALLLNLPSILPTLYGKHSYLRYIKEASRRAIRFHTIKSPRIALDIDTIEDLADFIALDREETQTHKFLMEIGIPERLSVHQR